MVNNKIQIIGGGTVFHVASHLALSAPAYGQTARYLSSLTRDIIGFDTVLTLTKMAGGKTVETNEDVAEWVDEIVKDPLTKIVFFNAAMADFEGLPWTFRDTDGGVTEFDQPLPSGKYVNRLQSSLKGVDGYAIELLPAPKIVNRIRKDRKDITLVAFKTTCGATEEEQNAAGLNLLQKSSSSLVLANDVKTRLNMVITPDGARLYVTKDRNEALCGLVEMACAHEIK